MEHGGNKVKGKKNDLRVRHGEPGGSLRTVITHRGVTGWRSGLKVNHWGWEMQNLLWDLDLPLLLFLCVGSCVCMCTAKLPLDWHQWQPDSGGDQMGLLCHPYHAALCSGHLDSLAFTLNLISLSYIRETNSHPVFLQWLTLSGINYKETLRELLIRWKLSWIFMFLC